MAFLTRKRIKLPKKRIIISIIVIATIWYNIGTVPTETKITSFTKGKAQRIFAPERINTGNTSGKDKAWKYILNWTPSHYDVAKGEGQQEFAKCSYSNCYLTTDRTYLKDIRHFDALLFSTIQISINEDLPRNLPEIRSDSQKYIIAGIEPAPWLPITSHKFENFFNWTWTYRLDSDILWRYFVIHGKDGEVGPRMDTKWLQEYIPITEVVRRRLRFKSQAVAWIVSHCITKSGREVYAYELRRALNKYNLSLDVFGDCGGRCGHNAACLRKVKREYYFYLAFEHTFDQDYATEKLLIPMLNYAVPVVLGGANYSRFLPPDSYLNAKDFTPEQMAANMYDIISNNTRYQLFFRWIYQYSYKWAVKSEVCNLCEALNNNELVKKRTVYQNFTKWWHDSSKDIEYIKPNIEKDDEFMEMVRSYKFNQRSGKKLVKFVKRKYFTKAMMPWEKGTLTHYVVEATKMVSAIRGVKIENHITNMYSVETRLQTNHTI